jgi:signal transduction histidine kinase
MRKSLYWKLTLAFILVAFITTALVAVFIRITSADSLSQLIIQQQRSSLNQALVDYYSTYGSWNGIANAWQQLQSQSGPISFMNGPSQGRGPAGGGRGSNSRDLRGLFGLADERGVVIVGIDPHSPSGTKLAANFLDSGSPILVNGKQVGVILTSNQQLGFLPDEALFLEHTNQALVFAILGALVIALILGIFLARTLTLPLRALTAATQRIAQGELDQQVKVTSQDEIGKLAEAFNRMSQEVVRVNQLRRRMTADIAHDLRTPLTVIGGYIESMRDGVLAPTPERLSLIYAETERLQNMVGDLRMLSQVDAGELALNPQRISPKPMLERVALVFEHKAEKQGVTLFVDAVEPLPEILVDEARLMQVMDNLLGNALRYTSPGGKIMLSAQPANEKLVLTVKDTGRGIATEELPFIFDRFYRADPSRHSDTGESGLGLAIVKALVEAQGGRAWAESVQGKGTSIHLEFPVLE